MPEDGSDDRWYAGRLDGVGHEQAYVIDGFTETPLTHHVRHSPDGFSWGYGGSGPADLARCILIDALGEEAVCRKCDGTGAVVDVDGELMSVARAEEQFDTDDPTSVLYADRHYVCPECDNGFAVESALYQAFKFDVVARFTQGQPWSLPREQVLAWLSSRARVMEETRRQWAAGTKGR